MTDVRYVGFGNLYEGVLELESGKKILVRFYRYPDRAPYVTGCVREFSE